MTLHLSPALRPYADGVAEVALPDDARTVGEALRHLYARHPALRDRVEDETGRVRLHVNVFVGDEPIRTGLGKETPIPPRAELHIIPAVSGG
jgi:molybdopterin converting factor small subunit